MRSLVIYTTTSGNTRTVAEAIAAALRSRGPVELLPAEEIAATPPTSDLVVIGGPTEGHGMSKAMTAFFERLGPFAFRRTPAAAFDTRLRWPRILSGSAAEGIGKRLTGLGARLLAPPESFMVSMKPELEPGEVERAAAWAQDVAARAEVSLPTPAG